MKLPGAERAVVDAAKLRDYLLAPDHLVGGAKARVFAALGFTRANWGELRRVFLALARESEAYPVTPASPFGQKYLVRATLQGPGGRAGPVTTVWIVRAGEDFPRFVTAYPGEIPGEIP